MTRKLTLNQAQRAALQGHTDTALSALKTIAETDDAASASLAELFAYRGRWEEVILHSGRLIKNPSAVYAGNVFNDMIGLLARAGHETAHWQQIREVVKSAWDEIDRAEERAHTRERYFKILRNLDDYSLRNGGPPHELIRVFGKTSSPPQAERDVRYQEAVHEATYNNQDLRQNPAKMSAYLFAIAANSNQPGDVIEIYSAGGMPASFDNAVHVAQVFVSRNEAERGWQALWNHMRLWWPVDKAQVAPIVLLTDVHLRLLMSQERCEQVLALPRGPEAER